MGDRTQRLKGKANEAAGKTKRAAGYETRSGKTEAKGAAQTLKAARNMMGAARVPVETSKGEWGRGQHEINFVYAQPLPMADMHVVFKQGIKELAAQRDNAFELAL